MGDDASKAFDQVERLTESQKKCLRLVHAHMTSKQIARELEMSPHTVDAHLKASLKTLGVANRTEAALILARSEGIPAYQPLAYQPLGMVNARQSMDFPGHGIDPAKDVDYTKLVQTEGEHTGNIVHDAIADADFFKSYSRENLAGSAQERNKSERRKNRLPIPHRLGLIVLISFLSILSFAAIVSALQSLSSLYN